jgi:hypothetical protein
MTVLASGLKVHRFRVQRFKVQRFKDSEVQGFRGQRSEVRKQNAV